MKNAVKISEGIEFRKIGGYVLRLVNPATVGSKNIGTSMCYLNPGEEIIQHKHEYEEVYFIVSGEGTMVLEGEKIHLEKNLSVYVPSNAMHGQKNDGQEPLVIHCALSPAPKIS
jgi:mannose-6-phosphate isomerase-like protein (cupin superfamily)